MRPRLHRLNSSHCIANNQFLASNLQELNHSYTSLRRINLFLKKQPYSNSLDQKTISQIILRNPSQIMVSYTFDSTRRKKKDFQNQLVRFQMAKRFHISQNASFAWCNPIFLANLASKTNDIEYCHWLLKFFHLFKTYFRLMQVSYKK